MKRLATYLYFRESGFSRRDAWRVATGEIQARLTSWAELRIEILTAMIKGVVLAMLVNINCLPLLKVLGLVINHA